MRMPKGRVTARERPRHRGLSPPRLGEILGRSEGGVNSRPVKDIAAKCPFANIYYIW